MNAAEILQTNTVNQTMYLKYMLIYNGNVSSGRVQKWIDI